MSDVMATGTKIRGTYLLRLFAGLLLGFGIGVDVSRQLPQSAFVLSSLAVPSAIVIIFIAAFLERRQRD